MSTQPLSVVIYDHVTAVTPPKVKLTGEERKLLSSCSTGERLLVSPIDLVCAAVSVNGKRLAEAEQERGLHRGTLKHDREKEEMDFLDTMIQNAFKREFPAVSS